MESYLQLGSMFVVKPCMLIKSLFIICSNEPLNGEINLKSPSGRLHYTPIVDSGYELVVDVPLNLQS